MTYCPTSTQEWDKAASEKNCSKKAAQQTCTDPKKFLYHCVINGYQNETLEVCAPQKLIIGLYIFFIIILHFFFLNENNLKKINICSSNLQVIAQSSMLLGVQSKVILQRLAATHFRNVTPFITRQMHINVSWQVFLTMFWFLLIYQYVNNNFNKLPKVGWNYRFWFIQLYFTKTHLIIIFMSYYISSGLDLIEA